MFTSSTIISAIAFASLAGQATASVISAREAGNPVDACNGKNNYGVGHDCSWNDGSGVAEGTCQTDGPALVCKPNARRSLDIREAGNPVDACNGSNNYGVGHDCSWNDGSGVAEGTCQMDGPALVCKPNARRSLEIREAGNPVDACNGSNNYGVGHDCSWKDPNGIAEGTCQMDGPALVCKPNARRSLITREAVNPVDACNGSNNYGVGHDCSWNAGSGVNEGTCQIDGPALVCKPNSRRSLVAREVVNPVDACNGSNNYGVGHDCSWNAGSGVNEGTCQMDGPALVCKPN